MGNRYKGLTSTRKNLIEYISQFQEKANDYKILYYFNSLYPNFTRQEEAKGADGYVSGHFVLELKGKRNDWLSGFFQGLSYKYKKDLNFSLIVVACKGFLTIWNIKKVENFILSEISKLSKSKAPNVAGKELAKKYKNQKDSILQKAIFKFESNLEKDLLNKEIERFETTLKEGRVVRLKVTTRNFGDILKQMKDFFDPKKPRKTVRAFYNMLFVWKKNSTLTISNKNLSQAMIINQNSSEGEVIEGLIPGKRLEFKDFVESHHIYLYENENIDDFFAKYDIALDAVDENFRKTHGIFFTDLDLSKFAMWFVRKKLGDIGKNYLVIDPACGSGNLVTNWRSPLELRHKVVSEIVPELLYTVEKRMKGDAWHHEKFTVIPKVSKNKGLNFLDTSAEEYLKTLTDCLKEKGESPDKPIAFLCNPPYNGGDNQRVGNSEYKIDKTILDITGNSNSEIYCSFLAQMRLICKIAKEKGLPENSLLLLFTSTAWLTEKDNSEKNKIKKEILNVFEDVDGFIVNSKEFFDVTGKFPIAFTIWKYKGENAKLDNNRGIELFDLTSLKKSDLSSINWDDINEINKSCTNLEQRGDRFKIGLKTKDMTEWLGQTSKDFKRNRRADEQDKLDVGGLPKDHQKNRNRKAYGEAKGKGIGFKGDLTPVRINKEKYKYYNNPCLLLDKRFMKVNYSFCASGPMEIMSYFAFNNESAKNYFFGLV